MRTTSPPLEVAAAIRARLLSSPQLSVSEIGEAGKIIGSSLIAIDLSGLTRLEHALALLAAVTASGLVLSLGLADLRRTIAILTLLGGTRRQLAGFLRSEGLLILLAGAILGLPTGIAIAAMLVKLLTGIFDPPPESLPFPSAIN